MEMNLIEIEEKINQYFLSEDFKSVIKEYRNLWSTNRHKGVDNFVNSINVAISSIESKIQICNYSDDFLWTVNILPLYLVYDLPDKTIHKDRIKAIKQNIKDSQKGRSKMVKDEQRQRKKLDTISAWVY